MLDLITIGDVAVDTILKLDEKEAKLRCDLRRDDRLICFDYADKIPVEQKVETVGGNAANTAVGVSRLGFGTGIATCAGRDIEGQRIIEILRSENVAVDLVSQQGKTNHSAILIYQGERTIFVYMEPRSYELPELPPVRFIYLTSMGRGSEKLNPEIINSVQKNHCRLIFSPGTHQLRLGQNKYRDILLNSDYLFLNKEEAGEFLKKERAGVRELLIGLRELGVKTAVVTDGRNGAYAASDEGTFHCEIAPAELVDSTGAGDSFAAGLMAAIIGGKSLSEALRWGVINSASVVSRLGAQAGLLDRSELEKRLATKPQIQVKLLK